MSKDQFQHIFQLLRSNDQNNVLLGIELLKSTQDAALIIQFLNDKSYISGMICFPMVSFFQEHPAIWEVVNGQISNYKREDIQKWMPYELLDLKNATLESFCALANEKVKEYFPDFPTLSPKILTERSSYYCGGVQKGTELKDGLGWKLHIEARDVGPAEVIHEEEWIAIAHHPDFSIKIERQESGSIIPRLWLEKIPTKP